MPSTEFDNSQVLVAPSQGHHGDRHRHSRRRKARRIAIAAILVFVAVVVATAIAVGVYVGKLNESLSLGAAGEDLSSELADAATSSEAFYVLLLGSDARENGAQAHAEGERSDVMMLLRVDPKARQMTMLSIPRDTPYEISPGEFVKINEAFNRGGAAESVRAVKQLTGLPIAHVAVVHGTGVQEFVDYIGGITVDVPVKMDFTNIANEEVHLEPGLQRLNGAEALGVANTRYSYADKSDVNRQSSVRAVVQGIFNKVRSAPLTDMPAIMMEATKCVSTDMTVEELMQIVTRTGLNMKTFSGTGPYEGSINPWVSDLWLCYVDPDGWSRIVSTVDSGGDPSEVSYVGDVVTMANAPADGPKITIVADEKELERIALEVEEQARAMIAGVYDPDGEDEGESDEEPEASDEAENTDDESEPEYEY